MELNKHRIDICAISEVKKKGKGNSKYGNYILFYSGKEKNQRAQAGVGVVLHEKYENHVDDVQYINSNIMSISLKFESEEIHLISAYAPDMSKPREERIAFFNELQLILEKIPTKSKVFLLGDLNARIGNTPIPGIMQKFNEDVINHNGEMLITTCAQNELRINNTFFKHKQHHKYTFGNTRDQNSTIDYIITNREIHPSQVLDVRTLTSANVGTDHGLVLCKYRSKANLQKKKPDFYIEKFNIESFRDDSTKSLYNQRLKEKLNKDQLTTENNNINADELWEKIKICIIDSAKEAIGVRKVNTNGKQHNKPWFTSDVKQLAEEKKKAYLKYRNNRTPEEYEQYKIVRNRTTEQINILKKEYWERFSSEMTHDLYGGQKKIWGVLRRRKTPINEEIKTNTITPEQWENYIQNLYREQAGNNAEYWESDLPDLPFDEENISQGEVHEVLTSLKNRKAPGPDNITNEMFKYGGLELEIAITKLFQKIISTHVIPEEWRTSITSPIYKKGNKKDPDNYRSITLLNSISKILTKVLTTKVLERCQISEEQQGFRKNRSTVDAIFVLRQLTEKAIEFNKPLYLCFVDLTKAFDRVQLPDVIKILQEQTVNNKYIKVILELNKGNKTRIRTQHGLTKEVPILTGIRQGDSMSPTLFNLLMDKIIQSVNEINGGYKMGPKAIKILCYADDAILMAESEDELQRLLYRFQTTASTLNMNISVEKTESMVISRDPIRCKLAAYDQTINQAMKFKYLGVEISSCRNLHQEVRTQSNKAARISGCLRDLVWKNKFMSTESKVRIYKTVVRPVLTYAAETRAETTKTKSLLRSTEMRTLRTIKGVSLQDQMRNSVIREDLKITDIVRYVRSRRRYWRDHVNRMDNDRLVKWAKENKPNTTRPPGRPPKRWTESWTSTSQEVP